MLADTAAVIVGSAHCGGKWDGCANVSPMKVAMALIVACRPALFDCPIHLCDNGNRDGSADNPANRGEECMLETERSKNISARHYEKTGKPCSSELFSRWASKPIRAQMIKCVEDAELEASHRLTPLSLRRSITAFFELCDAPSRKANEFQSHGFNSS